MEAATEQRLEPGECIPWRVKLEELPPIQGDADLAERVWREVDSLGHTYIWHCLLSF